MEENSYWSWQDMTGQEPGYGGDVLDATAFVLLASTRGLCLHVDDRPANAEERRYVESLIGFVESAANRPARFVQRVVNSDPELWKLAFAKSWTVTMTLQEGRTVELSQRHYEAILAVHRVRETLKEGTAAGRREPISEAVFRACVGRSPEQDDMERVNCEKTGELGHQQCGWDWERMMPRFLGGKAECGVLNARRMLMDEKAPPKPDPADTLERVRQVLVKPASEGKPWHAQHSLRIAEILHAAGYDVDGQPGPPDEVERRFCIIHHSAEPSFFMTWRKFFCWASNPGEAREQLEETHPGVEVDWVEEGAEGVSDTRLRLLATYNFRSAEAESRNL